MICFNQMTMCTCDLQRCRHGSVVPICKPRLGSQWSQVRSTDLPIGNNGALASFTPPESQGAACEAPIRNPTQLDVDADTGGERV